MPKATVTMPDGAKVVIEGTANEVRELVTHLHAPAQHAPVKRSDKPSKPGRTRSKTRPSMPDAIVELKLEGFFSKPKGLADIKQKLASIGMIYPVTSISGTVLSLVKRRELGRVKEKGRWCYVAR